MKYLNNFLLIILTLFFSAVSFNIDNKKISSRLQYLALEPGADIPVIPGPSGTGIQGLYRSMGAGIKAQIINNDSEKDTAGNRPGQSELLVSFNKDSDGKDPEIKIPEPADRKDWSLRSTPEKPSQIINHKLKIISGDYKKSSEAESSEEEIIIKDIPAGFPGNLNPTPKTGYKYEAPAFYRGIYLNNRIIRKESEYIPLLVKAKKLGINTLVIDVQPRIPSKKFMNFSKENNFYTVARVVVFEGGLKKYPPSLIHLKNVADTSEKSVKLGFMEVQLDYIRFADNLNGLKLPLNKRYMLISGILKMVTDRIRPYGVRIGADIFGRIAFNKDDSIGQKLEVFSPHLDTIYPMLYPSHFYGDPAKIKNPYKTILDGTKSCMNRVGNHSKIIAYIQGFKMSVPASGLSLRDYIIEQIRGAEDSGGSGYIVWNAGNNYGVFFNALEKNQKKQPGS